MMKKKKLIVSVLALCLVLAALILLYIFVLKKSDKPDEKTEPPKNLIDGESTYISKITLYPEIKKSDLISVEIKSGDNVTELVSKNGSNQLYLKNYGGGIEVQSSVYSYLISVVTMGITRESDEQSPIRDLTEEQMKNYGATKDTCTSSYTVKYKDGEEEKETTVFIGSEVFSTQASRYVAVEGRNSVYTMINTEVFVGLTEEKCINPLICNLYKSEEVATSIKDFNITFGSTPLIWIKNITDESTASYGEATFSLTYPKKTLVDSQYFLDAATTLFSNFYGDSVVSINPDEETLAKYGLADASQNYVIGATHRNGKSSMFIISDLQKENEEEDGYYYVRTTVAENVGAIVRVPESTLAFMSRSDERLIRWAATNTPVSGFYKYLFPNEEANQSGIKSITLKISGFEETFYVHSEKRIIDGEEKYYITVTSKSGKFTYEDDYDAYTNPDYIADKSYSYRLNQFRNLYAYLINYPMPIRYCSLTDEEISKTKADGNFMFELTVVTNNSEAERYSYYTNENSPGYVIREESKGTYNGTECVFDSTEVIFETTRSHVNIVIRAINTLINLKEGEFLNPDGEL